MQSHLADADSKFISYKQQIEHSPLNVLRNELATKQIQIVELESKVAKSTEERDDYRSKFEKVKKDMVGLKK